MTLQNAKTDAEIEVLSMDPIEDSDSNTSDVTITSCDCFNKRFMSTPSDKELKEIPDWLPSHYDYSLHDVSTETLLAFK